MSSTDTPPLPGQPRRITIDAEHFAIRFWVPVLAIAIVVVFHVVGTGLLSRLIGSESNPGCVMIPVDIVFLIPVGYLIERHLKRIMPSRRSATLSDAALVITDERHDPPTTIQIVWDKTVNVKAWRFTVQKRTRVPKGWYCMALQLLQDEGDAIFYTFMSPQEAEASIGYKQFARLRPRKETQSNTDLSAVAEQRRLLKLEDERWEDGAEISRDDFKALLERLQRHVPDWL
jgi:hypothetical protein